MASNREFQDDAWNLPMSKLFRVLPKTASLRSFAQTNLNLGITVSTLQVLLRDLRNKVLGAVAAER